eukprot:3832816-Rhodomonas_salina.3
MMMMMIRVMHDDALDSESETPHQGRIQEFSFPVVPRSDHFRLLLGWSLRLSLSRSGSHSGSGPLFGFHGRYFHRVRSLQRSQRHRAAESSG